jgi:hypothetical protein
MQCCSIALSANASIPIILNEAAAPEAPPKEGAHAWQQQQGMEDLIWRLQSFIVHQQHLQPPSTAARAAVGCSSSQRIQGQRCPGRQQVPLPLHIKDGGGGGGGGEGGGRLPWQLHTAGALLLLLLLQPVAVL